MKNSLIKFYYFLKVNLNDFSSNVNSPFQDLLFDKDPNSFNNNNNNNITNQNNPMEDFPSSSDFLFFDDESTTSLNSTIIDLSGLMQ